jgi:hypothetical protein
MDDQRSLDGARDLLSLRLGEVVEADVLAGLRAIADVEGDLAAQQHAAVRVAAAQHTWAEIGAALGVTRQAAHQKFAKDWATTAKAELKGEAKAYKKARRAGEGQAAEAAKASMDELIAEFKQVGRTQRRKR